MGYKHADLLNFAKTKLLMKNTANVKNATKFNELTPTKQKLVRSEYKKFIAKKAKNIKGSPPSSKKKYGHTEGTFLLGAPPSKKRIETGKLMEGKVVKVPDQAKGAIKQKDKNLTAYGKAANVAEPDTIKKAALKKDWTIVSDNCFGVAYMKALNKPYESPFFSMYIYAPDYLLLLENFDEYMKLTPKAQTPAGKSKYKRKPPSYPVIILEGSKGPVEIHFAHEKQSPQEAIRKWESRTKRMNMDKSDMFVKMDSRDRFTVDLGKRFLALKQFPHKRLFVSEKYRKDFSGDKNVTVMDYKTMPPIGTKTEKLYPVPAR